MLVVGVVREKREKDNEHAASNNHPTQEGRVVTKFVIAKDGSVSSAEDDGSDLADKKVVACVVHAFASLIFPEPAGGPATVTYPIVFSR